MRSGSAIRLGRLVKERRLAGGYTRDSLLSEISSRGGEVEVSLDFLVKLELQRCHLALDDSRFWMIARLLDINSADIASCVIGAIGDILPSP